MDSSCDLILIRSLRIWAHVGFHPFERELGQWFELDLDIEIGLDDASSFDELSYTIDYSSVIKAIQKKSRSAHCLTIERLSLEIRDLVWSAYGVVPLVIELRKCNPPIAGFGGNVAVRRHFIPS